MSYYNPEVNYYMREGLFKFGQLFTLRNMRYTYHRNGFANFLCKGLVDDAVGNGFKCTKPGTDEEMHWNKKLQEKLEKDYSEIKLPLYWQRRDSKSLMAFMVDKEDDSKFIPRAFAVDQYRPKYNEFGDLVSAVAKSKIKGYPTIQDHNFSEEDIKADTVREIIFERRDQVNEGLSELEAPWDVLYAIYMLVSHSAYFVARAGGGQKKITVPETAINDTGTSVIDDLVESAAHYGAAHDVIVVPKTLAGQEVEFEVVTVNDSMKWMEIFDIYTFVLATITGIPQSTWKGLVPGQLAGAKVNEESYQDVLRDLQAKFNTYFKWVVRQYLKFYKWGSLETEFDISFIPRKPMSEDEEIALTGKKLDLAQKYVSIGFSREQALMQVGIEFEGILEDEEEEEEMINE